MKKIEYPNYILENILRIEAVHFQYFIEKKFEQIKLCKKHLLDFGFFKLNEDTADSMNDCSFKIFYIDKKIEVISFDKNKKELDINKPVSLKYKIGSIQDTDSDRLNFLKEIDQKIEQVKLQDTIVRKTGKNLIYFSVYFDTGFVDLFDLSLKSIYFNKWQNFDILVITDKETKAQIDKLYITKFFNIYFLITETPECGVQASMNKCLLYDFEFIDNYEKIFLMDCDILCVDNADIIFNFPILESQLYTIRQSKLTFDNFKNYYHGFPIIANDFIDEMRSIDQLPFNAGQFLFLNSNTMKQHFENIKYFIKNWTGDYFYEQCFFNYYFGKAKMTMSRDMDRFVALVCPTNNFKSNLCNSTKLIHFIGPSGGAQIKLDYIETYLSSNYATKFKT
jgi:hypothetical protein